MAKRKPKQILANNEQAYRTYLNEQTESQFKESKTGEETYHIWHNRIQSTLRWRENHWNGTKNWDKAYDLYKGKHWQDQDIEIEMVKSDNRRDRITVNLTGSSIQNMLPFLIATKPKAIAHPHLPTAVVSGKLQETLLNREYDKARMHRQVKRAGLDAIICGHGIVRDGFILELDEAVKKMDGDIVYADYVKKESAFIRRVSPYNFIFDPTASENDIYTARWAGEIVYMPVKDLLANSNHLKSTIKSIKEGLYTLHTKRDLMIPDRAFIESEDYYENQEDEVAVCFEIFDKKYKKYYLFADGVVPPLIEKEWPYPYLDGFPYTFFEFIPIPDCAFPIGLALFIEDQQHELNATRTRMFNHGRRFNRKYEVSEKINPSEIDKLADGADGTIVMVPTIGLIQPIQDAPMSQDHQIIEARIQDDIQRLSGMDSLIQGGALPSRTTAGEVNARGNLFRMKLDDRVESMDDAVQNILEHTLAHLKANLIKDQVVKVAGLEGEYWVEFTIEDIQDPVDITIESIAAPKTDPQIMRQQALQVFQITVGQMQMIMQAQVPVNWTELFKWMFEMLEVKDSGRFFAPSLTPNQPLQMQPVSNDLNNQQPEANTELQTPQDMQRQMGLAPLLNQSGLQV